MKEDNVVHINFKTKTKDTNLPSKQSYSTNPIMKTFLSSMEKKDNFFKRLFWKD